MQTFLVLVTLSIICACVHADVSHLQQPYGSTTYEPVAAGRVPGHVDLQHTEVSDGSGVIRGAFSYIDPKNELRTVQYAADKNSFHPELSHKLEDIESVQRAEQKHFSLYNRIAQEYAQAAQTQQYEEPQHCAQQQYHHHVHVDSAKNDNDNDVLRELLQRIDKMERNINIRFDQIQSHMDQMVENNNIRFEQMDRNINKRFDKLEATDLNNSDNIKNMSIVMETIVEQQMVITAEIFTVSQTLPFCCCQYQNTTESLEIETTTQKPVKSLPTNCGEAMGENDPDGVYQLNVTDSNIGPFDVYCMKKVAKSLEEDIINGTWLIIQRRQDNMTDFYQNWNMYQHGFGVLGGNFWIGLDKIYAITKSTEHELWIQLEDHEGNARWAKYSNFAIGNEYEKYALKTLGRYDGTAGDSLKDHEGQKWSTFDQDNDRYSKNCAETFKGAWWYSYCHDSNLNGMYGNNKVGEGIIWKTWHGHSYSLKYVHMAIRPRQ